MTPPQPATYTVMLGVSDVYILMGESDAKVMLFKEDVMLTGVKNVVNAVNGWRLIWRWWNWDIGG